jgi:hypothetical protein
MRIKSTLDDGSGTKIYIENYELWEAFAKYSAILEDSVVLTLLSIQKNLEKEAKPKFDAQKKFWHLRLGPGCPEEWISKMGLHFMREKQALYPKEVHLRYQQKSFTLETKDMYKFAV